MRRVIADSFGPLPGDDNGLASQVGLRVLLRSLPGAFGDEERDADCDEVHCRTAQDATEPTHLPSIGDLDERVNPTRPGGSVG